MRSYEKIHGLLAERPSVYYGEFPPGMSSLEIERWAREQRARIVGEHLAIAFLWLFRLPGRIAAALRRRDATKPDAQAA
ncbi:MAG: hypothetical protein ACT4N4_00080 [Rhodospirillales bacterium]